jgi:hypothetical protein
LEAKQTTAGDRAVQFVGSVSNSTARFHTNIINAKRLARKGLWHCGVENTLRMGTYDDNDALCRLIDHYDLDVVEYKPFPALTSRTALSRDDRGW